MKYTIIGSGAAGGVFGELLFSAGKQISFVDSGSENIEAILDRGLEIRKNHGPIRMMVSACTPGCLEGETLDCAVLCVRSEELEDAVKSLLPIMTPETVVVDMCLGRDAADFGIPADQVVKAVGLIDADYLEPGLVHCGYADEVYFEDNVKNHQTAKKLRQDLESVKGIEFVRDVQSIRYGAGIFSIMEAAGSVTNEAYLETLQNEDIAFVREKIRDELLSLAKGQDQKDEAESIIKKLEENVLVSTKIRSGTWRDLAVRHRKPEAVTLLNVYLGMADDMGCKLHACRSLKALLERILDGRRTLSSDNCRWLKKEYESRIADGLDLSQLKITVVGIGAIGSVVGACLARGGTDVEYVDANPDHVKAVNERGLEIREQQKDTGAYSFIAKAKAYTPQEYVKRGIEAECILLCVKAQYTVDALTQLLPVIGKDTFVVSIQNGVTEFEISRVVGRERTVCGFVNIGADYIEPGLVHFGTKGPVAAGEWDGTYSQRIMRLEKAMKPADMFEISDNPMGFVWAKVTYSAITVLTTLTNETVAVTIAKEKYHELMANLVAEGLAVAAAENVSLKGMAFDKFDPEAVYPREGRNTEAMLAMMKDHATIMRGTTKVHSGTWRDIVVRKRKAESHEHFRPIFELAEKHGIQMPMCHRLLEMLQEIEDGKRPFSDGNLDELLELDIKTYGRE